VRIPAMTAEELAIKARIEQIRIWMPWKKL
jgi:hypothetical protein